VAEETFGSDIKKFVFNHFYVDDGLISVPTVDEAVDILKPTQMALLVHGNLRLHKFASSSKEVMAEFPSDDLTKDLKDLELSNDNLKYMDFHSIFHKFLFKVVVTMPEEP
jgi:hypothetical protein